MASSAKPTEDFEDLEYVTANEDFEDSRGKPSKCHKMDAIQCSDVQPAQDSEAKLVQFTLFKRLPRERQDAIWKFAIKAVEPRMVEIWEGYRKESAEGEYPGSWTGHFTSSCPIPGVLHACCDSRRLALTRWKLCFAFEKQPAKIFFDLSSDILYFGRYFDCMLTFKEMCNKADRRAVRKIAFHLQQQWESEYYEAGEDLAVTLHRDFPVLNEVVFVEKDAHYDWDRHEMGRAQRRPDRRKTVVTFCPPKNYSNSSTSSAFMAKYARKKWSCPGVKHMDFEKSYPPNLNRLSKPSDNADDAAWDGYFVQMEDAGEVPSDDEPWSEDDDDSEWGGWLDEVPDLQMRFMLATNPELRSDFGF